MWPGAACTQNDVCKLGVCTPGAAVVCPPADQCHVSPGTCNPTTGACSYTARADGTSCNADNSACTQPDTCLAGVCSAGPSCAVATPATPVCSNGSCVAACKAFGATGCNAGGCCLATNTCVGNTCAEIACQADGQACTGPAECCSRTCLQGRCGCVTIGNNCRYDQDCCTAPGAGSNKCSNNGNPLTAGVCISCNNTGFQTQSCVLANKSADCCRLLCFAEGSSIICDTPGFVDEGQPCTNPLQCTLSAGAARVFASPLARILDRRAPATPIAVRAGVSAQPAPTSAAQPRALAASRPRTAAPMSARAI